MPGEEETTGGGTGRAWARYALAAAAVAAAALLTLALRGAVGAEEARTVFVFFYLAVFASAWYGRLGPGVLAVALSSAVAGYGFFPPYGFTSLGPGDMLQVGVFTLASALIVTLIERSRRAERTTRRTEQQLAVTLRSIGDAVIATDGAGRVSFMNAVAEQLTGWAFAEAEGRPLAEVFRIHNELTREPAESPVEKVLRDGVTVGLANHTVLVSRDGRETPIADSGAPVRDAEGRTAGVVLVFHDVTESRKAADADRRLAAIFESVSDAFVAFDQDWRFTYVNARARKLLGKEPGEVLGQVLWDVFPAAGDGEPYHELRRAMRERVPVRLEYESPFVGAWIELNAYPLPDGGLTLYFRDVTERREGQERSRALLAAIPDLMFRIRRDGVLLDYNGAQRDDLAAPPEQFLGRNVAEVLPPEVARRALEHAGRALERRTTEVFEYALGDDGDRREYEARIVASGDDEVVAIVRNVTEGRRAESERARLAAQVESERGRLRDIVGSVPGVVWEAWGVPDRSSQRIDFVSDYVERMLGYTVTEWLATPNFWLQIVHPEDREGAARHAAEHFERGGPDVNRFRWVAKDGRVLHVESHSVTVNDAEGRPVGMRGVTLDVTDRVRAEGELRRSEERYRSLADAMPQIVWTADADGSMDYYNRRWFEYTGWDYERTRGWGWQPLIHPHDAERVVRAWATSVAKGRVFSEQFRLRRSDGQFRWQLARAEPMADTSGRVTRWFGTLTDIDDQKRAEERLSFLAESSELLASSLDYETTLERLARLAVNSLADYCLIDVVGGDGRIRRVAATHHDPARDPLVKELCGFPPDPRKAEGVPHVLRTGETMIVTEVTDEHLRALALDEGHADALRRLGPKSYMSVPLAARGRVIGALTCGLTAGGRAYSPGEVSFVEDLARRAALAINNARLFTEAQEANRAKDEFLATLSHELRTPLTPVIGWTHMLRRGRLPEADAAHGLRVIEKNADALSHLINDLLDMSSILSGKMRIEREPVEVGAAVREAADTIRPQAEARGVALEVEGGGAGRLVVSGDRTRLVQVFWNLLNNAVKFSREGGRVTVRLGSGGGSASVEVEDDGHGIRPDFLPHVFDRFRQADQSTTRLHGGLGIGLALVRSFVRAHGGEVRAESDGDGRGARFTVTLPLADASSPAPRPTGERPAPYQPASKTSLRVLLVEDAPDTLDMLRVLFEARGYSVVACGGAEEAISAAARGRFDLVVSDIGLPSVNGYELLRRLRALPGTAGTPALALTGYASNRDAEEALSAGFDAHIPKPVEPAALIAEAEKILPPRD